MFTYGQSIFNYVDSVEQRRMCGIVLPIINNNFAEKILVDLLWRKTAFWSSCCQLIHYTSWINEISSMMKLIFQSINIESDLIIRSWNDYLIAKMLFSSLVYIMVNWICFCSSSMYIFMRKHQFWILAMMDCNFETWLVEEFNFMDMYDKEEISQIRQSFSRYSQWHRMFLQFQCFRKIQYHVNRKK